MISLALFFGPPVVVSAVLALWPEWRAARTARRERERLLRASLVTRDRPSVAVVVVRVESDRRRWS